MRWLSMLICLVSTSVWAEEKRAYSQYFNGSFWDVSARGGASDLEGWSVDAGIRQSFPMYLGDTRLSYRRDFFSGGDVDTIHVGFGLHPLYVVLLGSDWLSYVVASFYAELGAGATIEDGVHPAWNVGVGIDFPLWDPDTGMAPWLNVLYRYEWTTATLGEASLDRGTGFIGLSWRVNGLLF